VFAAVEDHRRVLGEEGIRELRREQRERWFEATLRELLVGSFLAREDVAAALPELRRRVREGTVPATAAALELLARD